MAPPRAVLVTRKSEYDLLIEQHATANQARFFLEQRGQSLDRVVEQHHAFARCQLNVRNAVPRKWRYAHVPRDSLHRFLFEPRDIVVVLGQDGLVANVAKYLDGQRVVGLNPDPRRFDGVLVRNPVTAAADLMQLAANGTHCCQQRTMVQVKLDDGQQLWALNELFVGHASHQSARYKLAFGGEQEVHSSSGVVIASGTGCTGWARSIAMSRKSDLPLPSPQCRRLSFFVREAFPSRATATDLVEGNITEEHELVITSRMNSGGVIFGDGIEDDALTFDWGQVATIGVAPKSLQLVCTTVAHTGRAPGRERADLPRRHAAPATPRA